MATDSEPTHVTLRDHVEALIANLKEALDSHVRDDERMQDDLHRDIGHVHDTIPDLLPRKEFDARHSEIVQGQTAIASRLDRIEAAHAAISATKQVGHDNWGLIVATVGMVIALGTLVAFILVKG